MKSIPAPILRTISKIIVFQAIIVFFGVVWSIASKDHVFLILSAAIGLMGGWRTFSVYRLAADGKYDRLEGTVLADKSLPLRNRHSVILRSQDGSEIAIPLTGKANLRNGRAYELYLSRVEMSAASLPEQLQPARTLLGYEEIA